MASFFSSVQRVTSTFCALIQLMHIYQLLPYVLNTSFSTHPKRLTWEKASPFYIFGTMRLTGNFEKKIQKKIRNFFFSIFSFLRAFVVSSCRKSGFRVFLSLRYGADLGRSRLVWYNAKYLGDSACFGNTSYFFIFSVTLTLFRKHPNGAPFD